MRKKVIFGFVFLCLLCSLVYPVFSTDGGDSIIEGKVVCEDDIDFSGLEIEITQFRGAGGGSYSGDVVNTVSVDEEGRFFFEHPGGAFAGCNIKNTSLPTGYASHKSIITESRISFNENMPVFSIARIAGADITYGGRGGGISCFIYDEEGNPLYCHTEYIEDPLESYEDITYEEVKALKTVARKGRALLSGLEKEWRGEDILGDDTSSKIGYLNEEGAISLDKYYDLVIDWWEDDFDGVTFMCGNPIMQKEYEIKQYANQTEDKELRARIINVFGPIEGETKPNTDEMLPNNEAEDRDETYLIFLIPCVLLFAFGIFLGVIFRKKHK